MEDYDKSHIQTFTGYYFNGRTIDYIIDKIQELVNNNNIDELLNFQIPVEKIPLLERCGFSSTIPVEVPLTKINKDICEKIENTITKMLNNDVFKKGCLLVQFTINTDTSNFEITSLNLGKNDRIFKMMQNELKSIDNKYFTITIDVDYVEMKNSDYKIVKIPLNKLSFENCFCLSELLQRRIDSWEKIKNLNLQSRLLVDSEENKITVYIEPKTVYNFSKKPSTKNYNDY